MVGTGLLTFMAVDVKANNVVVQGALTAGSFVAFANYYMKMERWRRMEEGELDDMLG